MAEVVKKRLNKVLTELNISMDRAVEYLAKKGIKIDPDPNAKIAPDVYQVLAQGFEHIAAVFGQFVQKQNTVMSQ